MDEKNLKTQATAQILFFFFCDERRVKQTVTKLSRDEATHTTTLYCPRIYPPNNKPRESCSDEEDKKDLRRILDDNLDEE